MPALLETTVTLTRDGIWPYRIFADPGEPWPSGADARIDFKNTSGVLITSIPAQDVSEQAITFLAQPAEVNDIPAGAVFETFIDTDDGPLKIRYGTVMRHEAKFFNPPAATVEAVARKFSDTLQRTALGNKWEAVAGGTKLYDNSGQSLAVGMGPNTGLFSNLPSAVRWFSPLSGDSVESSFTIVMPTVFGATNGKTSHVICADHNFTSGLAVEVDSVNDQLHMARITGPTTLVYLGSAISNVPVSNDVYKVIYNHQTDTLAIYKGTNLTPLGTPWVDTSHVVPHGGGYRYTGFIFKPTFLETGPQVSSFAAKDTV